MNEGCGCSDPEQIGGVYIAGQRTGIIGLERLLKEWREAQKTPQDLSDAGILRDLRRRNYVPRSAEAEYAEAVREKYREIIEGE